METKWIKLSINIFYDEKIKLIENMPNVGKSIIVVWLKLLCLAGKINDNGYIYFSKIYDGGYNPEIKNDGFVKSYTEEQIAIMFSESVDIIRLALKTFIELEMIIIDKFGVIFLENFGKYQNIEKLNKMKNEKIQYLDIIRKKVNNGEKISDEEKDALKREQARLRVKKYREKQKQQKANNLMLQDVTVISNDVTYGNNNITMCNDDVTLCNAEENECNGFGNTNVTQSVTSQKNEDDEIVENTDVEKNREALPGALQNALHKPLDIDKDIDIDIELDKDIDLDLDKENKKREEDDIVIDENCERKISEQNAIRKKIKEVFGYSNYHIEKECLWYLQYLSSDVIIYGLGVTAGINTPCWNYAKKVLETYKQKKLCTMDLLLDYEDKRFDETNKLPKNIPKQKFAFMDDYHTTEEWESLYDN